MFFPSERLHDIQVSRSRGPVRDPMRMQRRSGICPLDLIIQGYFPGFLAAKVVLSLELTIFQGRMRSRWDAPFKSIAQLVTRNT